MAGSADHIRIEEKDGDDTFTRHAEALFRDLVLGGRPIVERSVRADFPWKVLILGIGIVQQFAERQSETDEALASRNHHDTLPVTAT